MIGDSPYPGLSRFFSMHYTQSMQFLGSQKQRIWSWYLYDWANSAFSTIIITFVFSVYMTREVMGETVDGSGYWSLAIAFSGIMVALIAPLIGGRADRPGGTAYWIRGMTLACAVLTVSLVFVQPSMPFWGIILALAAVSLAHMASELSYVFYNAMLPDIAPEDRIGQVSGIAWGIGFFGGICSLFCVLVLFIGIGQWQPVLDMPKDEGWHVRMAAVFVGFWYLVFALPLLLSPPSRHKPHSQKITGWAHLKGTAKTVLKYPSLLRLLIASAFYRDGLATLFAVGGTFAAAAFNMSVEEIMIFAIGLNVASGFGAVFLAKLDDIIGSRAMILLSLCGLIITGLVILFLQDKTAFILASLVLGIFIGPAQSSSRTYVARLSPSDKLAQIFGFYALSGKAIAFAGPLIYGGLTLASGSARVGLASIIAFWLIGALILLSVEDPCKREREV